MVYVTYQRDLNVLADSFGHNFTNESWPLTVERLNPQMWEALGDARDIRPTIHGDQNLSLSKIEFLNLVERATHHTVVAGYAAMRAERCGLKRENQD